MTPESCGKCKHKEDAYWSQAKVLDIHLLPTEDDAIQQDSTQTKIRTVMLNQMSNNISGNVKASLTTEETQTRIP